MRNVSVRSATGALAGRRSFALRAPDTRRPALEGRPDRRRPRRRLAVPAVARRELGDLDGLVLQRRAAGLRIGPGGQRAGEPLGVVALGVIQPEMAAAALGALQRAVRDGGRDLELAGQ